MGARVLRTREQFHPEGFTGLHLKVTHFERVADEQVSVADEASQSARRELARLVERLRARLGEEVVAQAELAESHIPECGYRVAGVGGDRVKMIAPDSRSPVPDPRPLLLLPCPTEVRVMVSPSHDRDGRPVAFAHEGRVHRVDHAIGPERISGQWWSGRHKTRDYFDATDGETGRRFWLFRVVETGRWYLHGEFE
jgi:protein ImuB